MRQRDYVRSLPAAVRYYGCPAEEGGAGKTFMVAAGLFRDVGIAITWHPSCITQIIRGSSLASSRIDFTFHGRSFHAASLHLGRSTLDAGSIKAAYEFVGCTKSEDKALYDVLLPEDHSPKSLAASTDVGDVSWCVPTVQIWGANYAIGTPFHTWQMVAQGKSRLAYRGMFHAAKVMAMTAKEAFCDPDLVREAMAELVQRVGTGYTTLLPADARPGFD
ncbi:hypothetical protein CLV80_11630 [Yoonia maritima]|uniref:Uncharacterized protein n=1 Tax=Yoonia maritima TaxID=1435347 RepID=A0A2T0VTQ5_9RHOB|nr:amidohydrolase [Yoonia maritima]PRY74648.1 hypothetical protein CLV80_11630 [Yoonia maritima]